MNLLDQMRQQEVPRPPAQLRKQVRERMNASLLLLQLADLALRGLPYAMLEMGKAPRASLRFTLSGAYQPRPRDDARRD